MADIFNQLVDIGIDQDFAELVCFGDRVEFWCNQYGGTTCKDVSKNESYAKRSVDKGKKSDITKKGEALKPEKTIKKKQNEMSGHPLEGIPAEQIIDKVFNLEQANSSRGVWKNQDPFGLIQKSINDIPHGKDIVNHVIDMATSSIRDYMPLKDVFASVKKIYPGTKLLDFQKAIATGFRDKKVSLAPYTRALANVDNENGSGSAMHLIPLDNQQQLAIKSFVKGDKYK